MRERDQRRPVAVGAGSSPADPAARDPSQPTPDEVVQAVADLVDDLADGEAAPDAPGDPEGTPPET